MNKNPTNSSNLQDMIQKYREELMKANLRKKLPDEEQPLQTTVPLFPNPSFEEPAEIPADDIQTTAGTPFPSAFPEAPFHMENSEAPAAAGTSDNSINIPAPFPVVSDTVPNQINSPEPMTFWTPPCMQSNFNFPSDVPMQDTYTEPVLSEVPINKNTSFTAPAMWPYTADATAVQADVYATNTENLAADTDTPTLSQLWPAQVQNDHMPDYSEGDSTAAANAEADMECVVSPCPSLYWPQAVEEKPENTSAVETMNKTSSPGGMTKPNTMEEKDSAPPPSVIRPRESAEDISRGVPFEPIRPETETPAAQEKGMALLQMNVTTGKKAMPVSGVRIVLFKPDGDREILVKIVTTDKSGKAPPISLPASEAKYSLHSGSSSPTLYTIETSKHGYYHTRHIHVPMYGGVASVLGIELTPLPEDEDSNKEMVYDHSLPPKE